MKRLELFFLIICFGFAQENPVDKIKQASEEILKSYTQPLINTFGILTNTSLFHSAYSHKILGFDLSLKLSYSPIPQKAKFFSDSVLACSLNPNTGELNYFKVYVESTPTIFGPSTPTTVAVPPNVVAIPKVLPGGLNLPGLPYIMPQLNIGLILGSELTLRYIPLPFKGVSVLIYGVGLKENLNQFGPFKKLPVKLALGGAYQVFSIGEIVKSSNLSFQAIASKRLLIFEPTVGLGYEKTKVNFNYQFKYKVPAPPPVNEKEVTEEIKVSFNGENKFRVHLGCALRLGFIFLHLSYEKSLYDAFSLTSGITIR